MQKLLTRKINVIARHLYIKAGFTEDEKIDSSIYGESYDDRYIGYRLTIKEQKLKNRIEILRI